MKKSLFAFLAASLFATAAMAQLNPCDVNYDNKVNTADVVAIYNNIIDGTRPTKPGPVTVDDKNTFPVGGSGTTYDMVYVEAGTFMMGRTFHANGRNEDALPVHQVTLTNDYWIGATEITQEFWELIMNKESNNSEKKYPKHPVSNVTYFQAAVFCMMLNYLYKDDLPEGMIFRLPTEAEWEYAARGGKYSRGCLYSGSDHMDDVGWCYYNSRMYDPGDEVYQNNDENNFNRIHRVKCRFPNELGLYDMSGNVEEWCYDLYGPYSSEAQTNPTGATSGEYGVLRGGTPIVYPSKLNDAYYYSSNTVFARNSFDRNKESAYAGFRIVLGHPVSE